MEALFIFFFHFLKYELCHRFHLFNFHYCMNCLAVLSFNLKLKTSIPYFLNFTKNFFFRKLSQKNLLLHKKIYYEWQLTLVVVWEAAGRLKSNSQLSCDQNRLYRLLFRKKEMTTNTFK